MKVALLRCQQNDHKCPLTSCFKSLEQCEQGFAGYDSAELAGVFTIAATLEENVILANILRAKGAEAIHVVTCAFAHKQDGAWTLGSGLCREVNKLMEKLARETGLPCVKGTAHLPAGYTPEIFQ